MANECKICGGAKKDHFDDNDKPITQHVFSEEGQLMSQAEAAKARQVQQQPQPFALPARFGSTDAQVISRLVELLMEKEILSGPEALYIFGVGSKPDSPSTQGSLKLTSDSKYVDPAALFGSGTA